MNQPIVIRHLTLTWSKSTVVPIWLISRIREMKLKSVVKWCHHHCPWKKCFNLIASNIHSNQFQSVSCSSFFQVSHLRSRLHWAAKWPNLGKLRWVVLDWMIGDFFYLNGLRVSLFVCFFFRPWINWPMNFQSCPEKKLWNHFRR